MNLNSFSLMLADGPPPVNPTAETIKFVLMVVGMIVMFYLLMFRPQQKRTKELNLLLKSLKPGDKVVTSSGIVGTVVSVKDKTVALRSAETELEVLKSTIGEVTKDPESSQS